MIKRLWSVAVVLVAGMLMSPTLMANKSNDIDVVFIGNSITYGMTLGNPGVEAPPVRVKEIVSAKVANQVSIVNCGHSGSTTLDWLPGSGFLNEAINAAKGLMADGGNLFFSIMIGTNDSADQGPNGSPVSTSTYKTNMVKILDKLFAEYPDATVILNYPIWYSPNIVMGHGSKYVQTALDRLNSYSPILEDIAATMQGQDRKIYMGSTESYGFFENNNAMFTPEGGVEGTFYLHPNKAGANKLAEFWAASILKYAPDQMTDEKAFRLKESIAACKEKADNVYKRTPAMLTASSQITTNATTNNLGYLIDNNIGSHYETWPDFPADGYAYLQFDISKTPVDEMFVNITPRQDASYGISDFPKDVKFALSADGGKTWEKEIDYTFNLPAGFALNETYKTEMIEFGGVYNAVRMIMIKHQYDRSPGDPKLFGMSELQIYGLADDALCYNENTRTAGEALAVAVSVAKAALASGDYSDEVSAALQSAEDAFDAAVKAYHDEKNAELKKYVKGDALITRVAQISTNAKPLGTYKLDNLLDGNDSTVYYSYNPMVKKTELGWLQVDLDKPQEKVLLSYQSYKHREIKSAEEDNPTQITILASNNKTDWSEVAVLDSTKGMPIQIDQDFDSWAIDLGKPYSYLRLRFDSTIGNRADGSSVRVALAEMQMYKAVLPEESVLEDVNEDGFVNTVDVVAVYNYIASAGAGETNRGDVNRDGSVNTADVVAIYNKIANGTDE